VLGDHVNNGGGRFIQVFVEVRVTANDRGHDFSLVAQSGLKGHAGTDHAILLKRPGVGLFLAAHAAKELIQVMNYPKLLGHF
jgi:hypothetical protein